jgi:capsular polysaccharide biosynthesis protein
MSTATLSLYGRILRTRWRWVAWGMLLTTLVTVGALLAWPPLYRSQATVFVRTPGDVSQSLDGGDFYAQRRAATYSVLARGTGTASRVIADLGLAMSPEKLASRIEAQPIGGTALFQVAVRAPTAAEARRAAEVVLAELGAQVDSLEAVPGGLIPRAQLVVVNPPSDPRRIVVWGAPLYGVVIGALLIGATLGAGAAVMREIFAAPGGLTREGA